MFDSHSYAKGGRILHMLRKYVGDDAFFKSLSLYLHQNEYKTVEIHNLRLAFEEITGEDLNWFFDQWFLSLGHPELVVTHSYDELNKKLNVSVEQVQDTLYMPTYRLPLSIDYWVDGKKLSQEVWIENRNHEFSFNSSKKPQTVLFDGEQQLLALVRHKKTKEEYQKQYELSDKYFAKFRAISYLSLPFKNEDNPMDMETFKIMLAATKDKAWGIRDMALQELEGYEGEGNDKLFLRLKEIALTEEKTIVRAQALYLLADKYATKATHEFEENITHRSYSVSAEALNGYLKSGGGAKENYLKQFIDSDKSAYISVISEHLTIDPKAENESWYDTRIQSRENITYDLLINYATFLQNLKNAEMTSAGIIKIKEICLDKNLVFWSKFGGFQALLTFENNKEAEAAMKQIKEQETDERLKQFYNYF